MLTYIKGHWRGEQSLAHSCWVNGVLIGLPLNILDKILTNIDPSDMGVDTYFTLFAIYFLFAVPWGIWFGVGIIRSGSTHIAITGRKLWARVAQFMGWLNLVFMPFIIYGGVVVLWNIGLAVIGQDDLVPVEMSISENGVLVLNGNITFDSPDRFRELLSGDETIEMVQLESTGGYIEPALKIAAIIKERGLDTYTSVECDSACTYLFIAGKSRYLDFDGVLGFHLAGMDGLPDSIVDATGHDEDNLFSEQGVPQAFIDRIKEVPNDDIWIPTLKELVDANVVTHVYDYNTEITYTATDYCAENDCTALPGVDGTE